MGNDFQTLSLIVTVLGIILSIFSMLLIFLGKRIQGTSGKQQISYKGIEVRTDAVILLICISVSAAIIPLYFQYKLNLKNYPEKISQLEQQLIEINKGQKKFTVQGYIFDGESKQPLEGAHIRVLRITDIPPEQIGTIGPTDDQGSYNQCLEFAGPSDRLRLVAEKTGYSSQEIVISKDNVTFPPLLIKKVMR